MTSTTTTAPITTTKPNLVVVHSNTIQIFCINESTSSAAGKLIPICGRIKLAGEICALATVPFARGVPLPSLLGSTSSNSNNSNEKRIMLIYDGLLLGYSGHPRLSLIYPDLFNHGGLPLGLETGIVVVNGVGVGTGVGVGVGVGGGIVNDNTNDIIKEDKYKDEVVETGKQQVVDTMDITDHANNNNDTNNNVGTSSDNNDNYDTIMNNGSDNDSDDDDDNDDNNNDTHNDHVIFDEKQPPTTATTNPTSMIPTQTTTPIVIPATHNKSLPSSASRGTRAILPASSAIDLSEILTNQCGGAVSPLSMDLEFVIDCFDFVDLSSSSSSSSNNSSNSNNSIRRCPTIAISLGGGATLALLRLPRVDDVTNGSWKRFAGIPFVPNPMDLRPKDIGSGMNGTGGEGNSGGGSDKKRSADTNTTTTTAPTINNTGDSNRISTGMGDIHSLTFLQNRSHPVLTILHSDPKRGGGTVTTGRMGRSSRNSKLGTKHPLRIGAYSIDIPSRRVVELWEVNNVPCDARNLIASPDGGLYVIGPNDIMAVGPGGNVECVLAVNGFVRATCPTGLLKAGGVGGGSSEGRVMNMQNYPCMAPGVRANPEPLPRLKVALDGCRVAFVGKDVALLCLRDGSLYSLEGHCDDGTGYNNEINGSNDHGIITSVGDGSGRGRRYLSLMPLGKRISSLGMVASLSVLHLPPLSPIEQGKEVAPIMTDLTTSTTTAKEKGDIQSLQEEELTKMETGDDASVHHDYKSVKSISNPNFSSYSLPSSSTSSISSPCPFRKFLKIENKEDSNVEKDDDENDSNKVTTIAAGLVFIGSRMGDSSLLVYGYKKKMKILRDNGDASGTSRCGRRPRRQRDNNNDKGEAKRRLGEMVSSSSSSSTFSVPIIVGNEEKKARIDNGPGSVPDLGSVEISNPVVIKEEDSAEDVKVKSTVKDDVDGIVTGDFVNEVGEKDADINVNAAIKSVPSDNCDDTVMGDVDDGKGDKKGREEVEENSKEIVLRREEEELYAGCPSVVSRSDDDDGNNDSNNFREQNIIGDNGDSDYGDNAAIVGMLSPCSQEGPPRPRLSSLSVFLPLIALDVLPCLGPLGPSCPGPLPLLPLPSDDSNDDDYDDVVDGAQDGGGGGGTARIFPCGYGSSGGLAVVSCPGLGRETEVSHVECSNVTSSICAGRWTFLNVDKRCVPLHWEEGDFLEVDPLSWVVGTNMGDKSKSPFSCAADVFALGVNLRLAEEVATTTNLEEDGDRTTGTFLVLLVSISITEDGNSGVGMGCLRHHVVVLEDRYNDVETGDGLVLIHTESVELVKKGNFMETIVSACSVSGGETSVSVSSSICIVCVWSKGDATVHRVIQRPEGKWDASKVILEGNDISVVEPMVAVDHADDIGGYYDSDRIVAVDAFLAPVDLFVRSDTMTQDDTIKTESERDESVTIDKVLGKLVTKAEIPLDLPSVAGNDGDNLKGFDADDLELYDDHVLNPTSIAASSSHISTYSNHSPDFPGGHVTSSGLSDSIQAFVLVCRQSGEMQIYNVAELVSFCQSGVDRNEQGSGSAVVWRCAGGCALGPPVLWDDSFTMVPSLPSPRRPRFHVSRVAETRMFFAGPSLGTIDIDGGEKVQKGGENLKIFRRPYLLIETDAGDLHLYAIIRLGGVFGPAAFTKVPLGLVSREGRSRAARGTVIATKKGTNQFPYRNNRLHRFLDLSGQDGLFAATSHPTWFLSERGEVRTLCHRLRHAAPSRVSQSMPVVGFGTGPWGFGGCKAMGFLTIHERIGREGSQRLTLFNG